MRTGDLHKLRQILRLSETITELAGGYHDLQELAEGLEELAKEKLNWVEIQIMNQMRRNNEPETDS